MLRNPGKFTAISFALAMTFAASVRADSPDEGPGRGVARISVINGEVSVQRGDSGDWVAAALNAPLVVQDRVLTGEGSRAEVQFDYATMMRLAPNSEARLAELDNSRYLVQVGRGTMTFRVLRDQPKADAEISTPSVSVRPVRRGVYRITVQPDGSSEITVRSGEADIYSPRGTERIHPGQTMYARGNPQDPEFQVSGAIRTDEWDYWSDMRDRDLESSQSYQYVSSDVSGAEELDRNGRWVNTPEYGMVWVPNTSAGWAPYREGRWVWVDYYGWSWVSYEPWGWAPYHYGRWFYRPAIGWCWWPGGFQTRHYWSPALVAFFGFGGGGVGIGFGNVGWVPLAPYEPLHRWWGRGYYGGYRSTTYVDNSVHIVNNINIVNTYRNAGVAGGVTGVSRGDFGNNRITEANTIRVRGEDLRGASLVQGQMPVAPTRASLQWTDRQVRGEQFRTTTDSTRFFSRTQPAAVDRVPFDQQRQSVEQVARRTFGDTGRSGAVDSSFGRGSARGDVAPAANVRGADIQRAQTTVPAPAAAGRGDAGWRRMGERTAGVEARPAEQTPAARSTEPAAGRGQDNGWRRFGDPGPAARTTDGFRTAQPRVEQSPAAQPSRGDSRGNADNGWRRFGDAGPARESAPSASAPERGARQDFGGFTRSTPAPAQPDAMRSAPAPAQRYEAPRYEAPRRSDSGFGRSEAIRSAPPVVRERAVERSSGGGGQRGGGESRSDSGSRGDSRANGGNRGR